METVAVVLNTQNKVRFIKGQYLICEVFEIVLIVPGCISTFYCLDTVALLTKNLNLRLLAC